MCADDSITITTIIIIITCSIDVVIDESYNTPPINARAHNPKESHTHAQKPAGLLCAITRTPTDHAETAAENKRFSEPTNQPINQLTN